ncbi:MAG: hypothetical protein JW712_01670 [Dehalococcoidales bacterium]|nr:hypothetical protein [Dehalococcoidales bacterium]
MVRLLNSLERSGKSMGMMNTKQRCPKCGGNLFLVNDFDGWYEQCLQCSFIKYLDVVYDSNMKVNPEPVSENEEVPVTAV